MDEKLYGFYCKKHGYIDKFITVLPDEEFVCSECLENLLHLTNTNIQDVLTDIKEFKLNDTGKE